MSAYAFTYVNISDENIFKITLSHFHTKQWKDSTWNNDDLTIKHYDLDVY